MSDNDTRKVCYPAIAGSLMAQLNLLLGNFDSLANYGDGLVEAVEAFVDATEDVLDMTPEQIQLFDEMVQMMGYLRGELGMDRPVLDPNVEYRYDDETGQPVRVS